MIVLIMGVTGSGKTTVGTALATRLRWEFLDADDFHSAANKEKMHKGIPLTDADREPWLRSIHDKLIELGSQGRSAALACSALKQTYRDALSANVDLKLVYLKGSYNLTAERIHERHGHFAGEGILAGQFADLEEPQDALIVDVHQSPDAIVAYIIDQLKLAPNA